MIRKDRWLRSDGLGWLPDDELLADILADFITKSGKLSIWEIRNEDDKKRVIVALAADRDHLAKVDYVIFDGSELDTFDILVEQQDGESPVKVVDNLHYDVHQLTANKLVSLANLVSKDMIDIGRMLKGDVRTSLRQAADEGILDKNRIKKTFRSRRY